MKSITSFFDDILKIIAVSSILLFIAGFIDLKTYYGKFGININEYIGSSEVLLSSIDKLALVLLVLLLQMIIWLYFFNYLFDYNLKESMSDGERRPRLYHDETLHRFVKSKFFRGFWITITAGAMVSLILILFFPSDKTVNFFKDFFLINYWVAMCLYMAWIQTTRKLWELMKLNKSYNAKVIITFVVFVSSLLASVWIKNMFVYNRVRKYGNGQVEIFMKDSLRVSPNDTIKYIGRTEGYFFFWNSLSRKADVYPSGEISKIIIEKN